MIATVHNNFASLKSTVVHEEAYSLEKQVNQRNLPL